jgi:hypothetical protein
VSFSLAVFPVLSAAFADGDGPGFRRRAWPEPRHDRAAHDGRGDRPVRAATPLVDRLLGGGQFDAEDVARTAAVVAAFAFSIPFDALAYPLSRGLYATHDTLRQVVASFAGLAVSSS